MKRPYEVVILSKADFARTVRIYAPKKADRAIIMHDGQNAFLDSDASFGKSWRAIDILKSISAKNTAIIGIDSVDATREDDYMPFPSELDKYGVKLGGGKAEIYSDFIESTVIPYLDKRFGFRLYGMLGSSAGALATITVAARHNPRIKAYGMFSTPLFLSPAAFAKFFETEPFPADAQYTVYTGGSENIDRVPDPEVTARIPQLFVDDAFTLTNALRKSGATDITLLLNNKGVHDETCWRSPAELFFKKISEI